MSFSDVFIRRPVATTLIILAIVIFGAMSYRQLPVSDLPTVDYPTIQVQASLPGASPETMAAAVATPLEKQFSAIAGVDSISSTNSLGGTNITIQFTLDRDIDAAAQDVQSMIARAARQLPPDMPTPPSLQKVNPADQAILFLALGSDTLPLSQVNEYAETVIAQRLSTVKGVAQVNIQGAQKFAVRIDLDPRELASRQIGIDQVAQAVQQANSNLPTGTLAGPRAVVRRRGRRQADVRGGLPPGRGRLPQRLARAPPRGGAGVRRRGERQDRGLSANRARRLRLDPAPARRQHRRRSSTRSARCCRSCRRSCPPRSR